VRLPGRFEAGAVNDDLVSLLDLMPTMLDVANVDYPGEPELPGASLLGREGGGLSESREDYVVEIGRGASRWLSLRGHTWKYNYWLAEGWEELYDLDNDPNELNNLLLGDMNAGDLERADAMKAELAEWESVFGFEDSLDEDGALKNFGRPVPDHTRMGTNNQFPRWVPRLPDDERAVMESRGETVLNAIRKEDTFVLEEINLKAFKESGGSLVGTSQQRLLDEIELKVAMPQSDSQ